MKHKYILNRDLKWFIGLSVGPAFVAICVKIVLIATLYSSSDLNAVSHSVRDKRHESYTFPDRGNKINAIQSTFNGRYVWKALPVKAPEPIDNPLTSEKILLGRKLFFDKQLSFDRTVSCSTCHRLSLEHGGGDSLEVPEGIFNRKGLRNSPTVINAAFQRALFWDGRAMSLEDQASGPLLNPLEMGLPSLEFLQNRLKELPEYKKLFENAFGNKDSLTPDSILKSIASYERTLITPDSPYDRFVRGDKHALSKQQIRGMALFESTGCINCHFGENFSAANHLARQTAFRIFPIHSNKKYENKYDLTKDVGLMENISLDNSSGVWRVPTLRNVSLTSPYFHNGSVKELKEAIRIMAVVQLNKTIAKDSLGYKSYYWDEKGKILKVREENTLSEKDVDDIAAFLDSLTGQNISNM